jgi:hypothetical protein
LVFEQNLPNANSAPMKWLSPYGDSFNGSMLGKAFHCFGFESWVAF